ncbi:MAG TPA: CtpF protein [Methylocella sp.]|nr:CtpF protein [Methylocella sp.]
MKTPSSSDQTHIAPLPRISLQAFWESPEVAGIIQTAAADRRMERAHVTVTMGGIAVAAEAYRDAPTPNVIVLDTAANRSDLMVGLEALAEFCDAGTKVVVIGRTNDIVLYRELMARGISDYLVAPIDVLEFIRALSHLYTSETAAPVGRIIAVAGAKGGSGASFIAHNIAFSIARDLGIQTVIADLDLGFGTTGLDFNQDPVQGMADAVFAPYRIDSNLIDRLLSKCGEKLSLLAAPATLEKIYDFPEGAFDPVIDILRTTTPCVMLDIPHLWSAWSRRVLIHADEIVLAAVPDLANLRNAKNLLDTLRAARGHDEKPNLVMNFVGVPKRPEITVDDFAKAVDLAPSAIIPFEPKLLGMVANNGQMVAEVDKDHQIAETFRKLARKLTHRQEPRKTRASLFGPVVAWLGLNAPARAEAKAPR